MTVYLQHEEVLPDEWGLYWWALAPRSRVYGKPWLAARSVSGYLRMAWERCYRGGWRKWGGPR